MKLNNSNFCNNRSTCIHLDAMDTASWEATALDSSSLLWFKFIKGTLFDKVFSFLVGSFEFHFQLSLV